MTRKKVKIAWIENKNSRRTSLKKRRLGLMKKVRELSILCDVKACLVIFSRDEIEPMVWPSVDMTRRLLDDFFALPDYHQKRKETSLESYLNEEIKKVEEQLKSYMKKNKEYVIDKLMEQLQCGRRTVDLNMSEIYELICFSRNEIMFCRKKIGSIQQYPPLRDPPMHLFELQSEKMRDRRDNEVVKWINIDTLRSNQSLDQWILTSSELPQPRIYQQIEIGMSYYNVNSNPPVMIFHALEGSVMDNIYQY